MYGFEQFHFTTPDAIVAVASLVATVLIVWLLSRRDNENVTDD